MPLIGPTRRGCTACGSRGRRGGRTDSTPPRRIDGFEDRPNASDAHGENGLVSDKNSPISRRRFINRSLRTQPFYRSTRLGSSAESTGRVPKDRLMPQLDLLMAVRRGATCRDGRTSPSQPCSARAGGRVSCASAGRTTTCASRSCTRSPRMASRSMRLRTARPTRSARAGIPLHDYAFTRRLDPLGDLRAVRALGMIIDAVGPDIVHSFDTKPNLYTALVQPERRSRALSGRSTARAASTRPAGLGARCLRPVYNAFQRRAAGVARLRSSRTRRIRRRSPKGGCQIGARAPHPRLGHRRRCDRPRPGQAAEPGVCYGKELELGVATRGRDHGHAASKLKGTETLLAARNSSRRLRPTCASSLLAPGRMRAAADSV